MNYRSFIASAIKNGGMIKTSRQGLVPTNYSKSLNTMTSGLKHMKLGSGTPAHKKINEHSLFNLSMKKHFHQIRTNIKIII